MGEPSSNRRQRPPLQQSTNLNAVDSNMIPDESSLPPAYSSVLVDPSTYSMNIIIPPLCQTEIVGPRVLYNSQTHRSRTLKLQRRRTTTPEISTEQQNIAVMPEAQIPITRRVTQAITADHVAHILRPRQLQQRASSLGECIDQAQLSSLHRTLLTRSAENLVLNAAPPGQSSVIDLNSSEYNNRNNDNTSVI